LTDTLYESHEFIPLKAPQDIASPSGVTSEALESLRDKVFVYELGDLETVARDFEAFQKNKNATL
jgi:hypothetical protein